MSSHPPSLSLRRCTVVIAALLAPLASGQAPPAGPRLQAVLGQPDLAAPVRIRALAWLAGGRELLALDTGRTAQLWDTERSERRGVVTGVPVLIAQDGLRAAPDGRGCTLDGPLQVLPDGRIVRAYPGLLRFCDPSGTAAPEVVTVAGLTGDATALAVAADGSSVAEGTATGEVLRASLPGGALTRIQAHEGRVLALQLGGKGQLLSAGADGTVRVFGPTGERLSSVDAVPAQRRSPGAGCEVESPVLAVFAPDASAVLVGTVAADGLPCPEVSVPARLRLVELPKGRVRWELKGVQASAAAFGPGGVLAVAVALHPGETADANPSMVLRLNAKTGVALDRPSGHRAPVTVLRFTPDGRAVLTGDAAGTWKRWALDSGREQVSGARVGGAVVDLRLLPDGQVLTQGEDDAVRRWRADGTLAAQVIAPPAPDPLALSPLCRAERDRTRAALAGMQPRASVLPLNDPGAYAGVTLQPELVLSADGETLLAPVAEESCVSLSPDGCPSGCQRRYHLERISLRTGKTLQSLDVDEELLGGCVPPGGAFTTRGERAGINLYSASGELEGRIGVVLGRVSGCETTPDGRRMLVATARSLSVWDAGAFNAPVEAVERRARTPGPVALSPRGDLSVDVDGGEVRLRRWPKGGFVARLPLGALDDGPTAVAFSSDGQLLAVGTARGVVYLYALAAQGPSAQRPSGG